MAGIFSSVEKNIIGGITDATNGLMMSYSSMMMGLAATSATIYIMWRGYQTLAGKLSTPMEDVMWDIMRMAIILSFVANINGYLDGVIDAVNGIKEGFSSSTSIWQLLDTLWNSARVLGKTLHDLDNSEFIKEEGTIAELFVWGGVFVLMIITAFVSMIAEIMILLLGITAPIFIFCLMYGFLRPMFNNWLQNIFAAILTIMFSALALRIVIGFLTSRMSEAVTQASKANIVETWRSSLSCRSMRCNTGIHVRKTSWGTCRSKCYSHYARCGGSRHWRCCIRRWKDVKGGRKSIT